MNVNQVIDLLPRSLYEDNPEARRILVAMLTPIVQVDSYLAVRTSKLDELLDPSAVPDGLVRHLAALVGMGTDLEATNAATIDEVRRLIPVAVRLWKMKGARPSWRALPASLSGSRSLILDWFYLRTISGAPARVAVIPPPGGAGYPYSSPEYVTDLWIMDPSGSGVNLTLLARFLDVVRGAGERINLYRALLVDDLGAGAALWSSLGTGGSWSYDPDAWELTAANDFTFVLEPNLEALAATWSDYHATLRLAVTGTVRARIYDGPADNYRVTINQVTGLVQLHRLIGGVPVLLGSFAGPPLVAGFPYLWSLEAWEGFGATTVRVYREGAKLIDVADANPGRPTAGGLRWQALGVGSTATLSTALVWPSGIAPLRIGPTP